MKPYLFFGAFSAAWGLVFIPDVSLAAGKDKPTPAQATPAVSPSPGTPSGHTPTPESSISDESISSPAASNDEEANSETAEEKPFEPHWTGQLGLTYSNQPTQQGAGQVSEELGLTGTYDFTETGNYASLELTGGQQRLEGANTNYGEITGEGGLGFGIFQPSLSLSLQEGAAALNSYSSTLNLNFQVWDFLTVGTTAGAGIESHQGPVSQLLPNSSTPDKFLEVDDYNWTVGAVVTFEPWEFLSFSLTAQQESDITYQMQNLVHTVVTPINQNDQIPSLTLEAEITFLKSYVLELSGQYGREYFPAGTVYSPILGKTVTFSKPTEQDFTGFSFGLMYNFQ